MWRKGLLALAAAAALAASAAPAQGAPRPNPGAPLLIGLGHGRLQDVLAVSATGRVLRHLPPCLGPRTLDGRYIVCNVSVAGSSGFSFDTELRVVDTLTGAARTVFRDTPENRTLADPYPVWSPDGRSLAFELLRQGASASQHMLAIEDVGTGQLRTLAEQPPCTNEGSQCTRVRPYAWTANGSALFVMEFLSGSPPNRWILDPATGARRDAPPTFRAPAPDQRTVLKVDGAGRSSLVDLDDKLLVRLPATDADSPFGSWSPNSRYVGNPQVRGRPMLYDRVTRRLVRGRIGVWAPDSKHHAVRIGSRIELLTIAGRRVRTLFTIPRATTLYGPHWMSEIG
jgi:hypothetical protein